jgi:AraC-like DNA-binding protein
MDLGKYEKTYHKLFDNEPISIHSYLWENNTDSFYDMHYVVEIGIILSGSMVRDHFGKEYTYKKGEVWLTGSWEPHGFRLESAPCEVLVIIVDPMFLSQADMPYMNWLSLFMLSPEERKNANSAETISEIIRISYRIETYLRENNNIKVIYLKNFMTEILLQLTGNIKSELPATNWYSSSGYKTIEKAVNLIINTKNYVSAEEAAGVCNMSRVGFSLLFKKVIGISFAKFGLNHRLSGAGKSLLTTNNTIENIAAEWGFTDSSHLTQCFTKHFGKSPGAHRKSLLG